MRILATLLLLILLATASSRAQQPTLVQAFPNLNFTSPVGLYNAGDGSNNLYVIEQRGVIRVFENKSTVAATTNFLDIISRVTSGGETGLLGIAFDPNFAQNGTFYLDYTAPNPLHTVIARYHVSNGNPLVADPASEQVLLTIDQPYANHNGGQLAFGPDGYLYIGMGDGGSGGDPGNRAQNIDTLLGKILRIDVHDTANGKKYGIPADNPFAIDKRGRGEIYAYGMRNPWRFSFDRTTGKLWCGDVGQGNWEEVDIIENGKNYGWHVMEGFHCYPPGTTGCDTTGLTLPIWEYPHDTTGGISITGGFVYRGRQFPSLVGKYIYADYGSGKIWALSYDGTGPASNQLLRSSGLTITSFGVDKDSNIYVVTGSGKIYMLTRPSGVDEEADARFALRDATPNPASGTMTISYSLSQPGHVRLALHDAIGREVATIVDEAEEAGEHRATLDASALASGSYYCRLTSGSMLATMKVNVVR